MPMPEAASPGADAQIGAPQHRSRWLMRGTCVALLLVAAMAPAVWWGPCLTHCGTGGSGSGTQAAGYLSGIVGVMDEGTERMRPLAGGLRHELAADVDLAAPAAHAGQTGGMASACVWRWVRRLVPAGQSVAASPDRASVTATAGSGACTAVPDGGFVRQH